MLKIAVMGYGVVGSGVVEVFYKNRDSIVAKAGRELDIKYILDLRDFPGSPYSAKMIKDFELIVSDPEIGVVVEVMGGLNPSYEFVRRCLEAGKSVVTSNKELVAAKGAQLLAAAREHGVNFLFEASVGGGIPIIRPISQCLAANEIDEISGILNGTTNFILTKMIREQMSFEDALALAQQLGYAERDPSADVDGHDACRKICILASLAFGRHIYPAQVHTEGISKLTAADVEYASIWGGAVKLIGRARRLPDGRLDIHVAPEFISRDSQLSTVDDVFNAIMVRGDATGDVMFYGRGAGKLPTASAVVADIIDCAKHVNARKYLSWDDGDGSTVAPWEDGEAAFYVRAKSADPAKAIAAVSALFGPVQVLSNPKAPPQEAAFVTPVVRRGALKPGLVSLASVLEAVAAIQIGE